MRLAVDDMVGGLPGHFVKRGQAADTFPACHEYADWFDIQRRVVRNARGPLGNPEAPPDWSLFDPPG